MKKFLLLITVIFVVITVTTCAEKKDDTVTLLTHDSFWISEGVFEEFTQQTGVTVEVQMAGDTGQLLASAILPLNDSSIHFSVSSMLFVLHSSKSLCTPNNETNSPAGFTVDENKL